MWLQLNHEVAASMYVHLIGIHVLMINVISAKFGISPTDRVGLWSICLCEYVIRCNDGINQCTKLVPVCRSKLIRLAKNRSAILKTALILVTVDQMLLEIFTMTCQEFS